MHEIRDGTLVPMNHAKFSLQVYLIANQGGYVSLDNRRLYCMKYEGVYWCRCILVGTCMSHWWGIVGSFMDWRSARKFMQRSCPEGRPDIKLRPRGQAEEERLL